MALIVTSVRDRAAARLIYGACKLLGERAGAIAGELGPVFGICGESPPRLRHRRRTRGAVEIRTDPGPRPSDRAAGEGPP